jgi:hypothetical protein
MSRQMLNTVPTRIELSSRDAERRVELERFVQGCFARTWGARVSEFMPLLAALRSDAGELVGVLGMRPAEEGPLFLEQYLDRPVEQQVAQVARVPVFRGRITEVGNLAAVAPGGGRWLITALTAYLHAAGREWVVFTGGPELRNAFHRLGLNPLVLGPADPARLGAAADDWGRYYEQQPMVMAGRVGEGFARLSALFSAECALNLLWRSAGVVGAQAA